MYRVSLTADEVAELNRLCRDSKTKPPTWGRLEMLRLANAGWSIPRNARHFEVTENRVRYWIKAFLVNAAPFFRR